MPAFSFRRWTGLAVVAMSMFLYGCGGGGASAGTSTAAAVTASDAVVIATATPAATATPVAATTPTPPSANDFEPPSGAQPGTPAEAPGSFRLMSARSTDGVTWVPTGAIVSDQANVPDMIVDGQGRIWLYYMGGQVGTRENTVALALSSDAGRTWTFKYVNPPGPQQHAGDPDVLLLPDGTTRMYLTTGLGANVGVVCLESANGIDFSLRGSAFTLPGTDILDSTTWQVGSTWHMLTLQGTQITQRHGTSTDGRTFSDQGDLPLMVDGEECVASNPVRLDDGRWRMYGFVPVTHKIHSFVSSDGLTWAVEPGARLEASGMELKDPAVVRLGDGTWFMVYTVRI